MAGETKIQLRLVRCPKCRHVLPELPEIPVYQCARCGTVLQAKHRKMETRVTESRPNDTHEHGKVGTDHIFSEKGKMSTLHHQAEASPSKGGGSSSEASTSRRSDEFQDRNIKQPVDRSYSDELPISSELSRRENGGGFVQEHEEQDKHIGSLDQDTTGESKHEFGGGSSYCHRAAARSSSDDLHSSMELTCNETEDSSPEFHSCLSRDKDVHTFDPCIRMETKNDENYKMGQDKGINIRSKSSKTEDKNREIDVPPKFEVHREEGKTANLPLQNAAHKVAENADCCRKSLACNLHDYGEHQEPKTVIEANQEVVKNLKDHMAERLKVTDNLGKNKIGSIYVAETILDEEDIPVQNSVSLDNNQHLEKTTIPRDFDCGSSVDSFDKLQLDNSPSSVFGMKQADFQESLMRRSYYSYDGSVSSFDGYEEQISGQFSKPQRRRFKHSEVTNYNGLQRPEESRSKTFQTYKTDTSHQEIRGSRAHGILNSEFEIQQEARKTLILDENSHYSMKFRQNRLDDLPESRKYGHPGASRGLDQEDYAAGLPFIPRYSGGLRNGAPLNYQHHVFQPYSGSFPSDMPPSYPEPDKEQLLRMVQELKEELNRTQISKKSRYFTGDEIHAPPLSYNHIAPASEEICADMHFPRYVPGTGLPPLHKVSRMSYSGDGAADYRNQVDCSCLHGCPHDWHYSGQVPSQMIRHNRVHCSGHSGHVCYKGGCYHSASSSPQHNRKGTRISLYGRETKSDEQNLQDTEMRRHARERVYSSKRHLMPVAGGIPIVACYHCSELLQLPADFLLFGRRYHRLKCNSCQKVMKFSLETGTHLTPNINDSTAPPPSMADDFDDSIASKHPHPHPDPLSCSDDYGMSFDRSCSTEGGEPPLMIPSSRSPKIGNGSPYKQPLEDRKMKSVLRDSPETIRRNSRENFRSEGTSMKVSKWGKSSSEIEELPSSTTAGSPLHRLMGYLSPSEVIKP